MTKDPAEFIFIFDKSKAMCELENAMVSEFNVMLREQQNTEGDARITTVLLDDRYELFHDRSNIQAAVPLLAEECAVKGSTALWDAIGRTMHKFRRVRHGTKEEARGDKVVFIIITGSRNRAGRSYTQEMIQKRIVYRRQKYGWEFLFFSMGKDVAAEAEKTGITAE